MDSEGNPDMTEVEENQTSDPEVVQAPDSENNVEPEETEKNDNNALTDDNPPETEPTVEAKEEEQAGPEEKEPEVSAQEEPEEAEKNVVEETNENLEEKEVEPEPELEPEPEPNPVIEPVVTEEATPEEEAQVPDEAGPSTEPEAAAVASVESKKKEKEDNNNIIQNQMSDVCQHVAVLPPVAPFMVYIPQARSPIEAIDFYPQCTQVGNKGYKQPPKFGPFSTLMAQANHWLASNPQYRVLRCESVTRATDIKGQVDYAISNRHEAAHGMRMFVRILRLWVVFEPLQTQPMSIWYFNVFPRSTGRDGIDMLEGVHATLGAINQQLMTIPLNGRILNIEHLLVNLENYSSGFIDMDKNYWSTENETSCRIALTYRIFFTQGAPMPQRIGVAIFVPDMELVSGKSKVQFGSMEKTLDRAMKWILENRQHRVTDIQTVVVTDRVRTSLNNANVPVLPEVNEDSSVFVENFEQATNHIKTLRVAYVADQGTALESNSISTTLFTPCKCGSITYESIQEALWRMGQWLKASQSKVFLMETIEIDHLPNWEVVHASSMNHEVIPGKGCPKLMCYRVYFDGAVRIPSKENLPPPPKVKSSSCTLL